MRITLMIIFSAGLLMAGAPDLFAHGGSHPTPWPTPPVPPGGDTPVPTPGPWPTPPPPPPPPPEPDPEPDPEPTPEPDPDPGPQPDPRAGDPRWTGGSDNPIEKTSWKTWWEINKWRFTRTAQKRAEVSGGDKDTLDKRIEAFLTKQLTHKYFDVRSAAAIALGKAGSKGAADNLRALVDDSSPMVAESALLALGMMSDTRSAPFLHGILKSSNSSTRCRIHAAVSLGLIGDESTARTLSNLAVKKKENDELKAACLLALSLMGREESGALFLTQMKANRVKRIVRAMACTALGKLGHQKVPYGKTEVETVKHLVGVVQSRRRDDEVRQSAAIALAALGPFSTVDQRKLVGYLTMALNDRDQDLRNFLIMTIAEIARQERAVDYSQRVLRNVLAKERNHGAKGFACIAVGLAGDRQSIPVLRRLLTHGPSPDVRAAAAVGLGLLEDLDSTKALLAIICGKGDKMLKGYCCTALGVMGSKDNREALPALTQVLTEEPDPELRAAAAIALTKLGHTQALEILLKSLSDRNQYFRMSAVMAVGFFRNTEAVEPLIKLYESGEANDELKAIICVALGHIAEKGDVPVLKKISRHYNFRLVRFRILKQIMELL